MVYHVPDVRARGLPQRVAMATDERGRGMSIPDKCEQCNGELVSPFEGSPDRMCPACGWWVPRKWRVDDPVDPRIIRAIWWDAKP